VAASSALLRPLAFRALKFPDTIKCLKKWYQFAVNPFDCGLRPEGFGFLIARLTGEPVK
jgi:hypothetical protein